MNWLDDLERLIAAWKSDAATVVELSDAACESVPRLIAIARTAERLLCALELNDVPGYIYDEHVALCCYCDVTAPSIAAIVHEDNCVQAELDALREVLKPPSESRAGAEDCSASKDVSHG